MANSHIRFSRVVQLVIFVLLALATCRAFADDNPYDLVGKALVPLANVFARASRSGNRAITASLVLVDATNLPLGVGGETVDLELQYPDKLRIHTNIMGDDVTVCRDGQNLWAFPGAKIEPLIDGQSLPKPDPYFTLTSFRLPVTDKQLVFLPVLFKVADAGNDTIDGTNCRVLDLALMPELARALKAEDWTARIWLKPDNTPARVKIFRDQWHATIAVKSLACLPSLPPETWQPTHDESMDVFQLTPARYKQLLDFVTTRWAAYKTE